ncbi:MAG TPA: quinone-dependent dihydroorotate dehydrogenase [Steroidobacteraceae bacterium]|nr:quinone-dependent dihydroorotate dehydrogenase [Steroidobacteraceae bacterium]
MASGGLAAVLARAALPVLQRLPPEPAHELALRALALTRTAWRKPAVSPRLAVHALGREFAHPVGLAAGFDKNGDYLDALGALGFSHVEVGTVTPRPQSGNPKPRLFRVREQRALINRMGFNNRGAEHVAGRLRASEYAGIRGVSIGKNADTPLERAADDYLACLRTLYDVADYFAINVSSPNTRGLRELQAAAALASIVEPLREERRRLDAEHRRHVPLLVKISPDLEPDELREMCAALKTLGLEGVIATNTSTCLPGFEPRLAQAGGGGISGAPLTTRALEVLRVMRAALGAEFPIISVGGIMSAADAQVRIAAGANLLQLYTGFVYRGAPLLGEILAALENP